MWATWCAPCRSLEPILQEISEEMKDQVVITKHNIDEHPNQPTKYGVRGLPTMLLFKNGELAGTKVGVTSKSNTIFIFINQLRSKIGVVFGNPETTTGGNALKFYSSIRLDVRRASQIKSGDEVKGHRMKIKVAKNKLAPPFRTAEVDLIYGVGISRMGVLIDLSINEDIVQKSGTWFSYNNERLGQGRDNSIKFLEENPEIAEAINLEVRKIHKLDSQVVSEESK